MEYRSLFLTWAPESYLILLHRSALISPSMKLRHRACSFPFLERTLTPFICTGFHIVFHSQLCLPVTGPFLFCNAVCIKKNNLQLVCQVYVIQPRESPRACNHLMPFCLYCAIPHCILTCWLGSISQGMFLLLV